MKQHLTISLLVVAALSFNHPARAAAAQNPNTCLQGYVWREAYPGDVVCVTPAVREATRNDNRLAASRVEPGGGAYGPNTCRQGYVWREARPNDVVCVTPQTREQAARDNKLAASRRITAAGPSTGLGQPREEKLEVLNPYCENYARAAVADFRLTLDRPKCRINTPPGRWMADFKAHYNWCTKNPRAAAANEWKLRQDHLVQCGRSVRMSEPELRPQ